MFWPTSALLNPSSLFLWPQVIRETRGYTKDLHPSSSQHPETAPNQLLLRVLCCHCESSLLTSPSPPSTPAQPAHLQLSRTASRATSGSRLRRARVTAAFCWTRSQAATSAGVPDLGFSDSMPMISWTPGQEARKSWHLPQQGAFSGGPEGRMAAELKQRLSDDLGCVNHREEAESGHLFQALSPGVSLIPCTKSLHLEGTSGGHPFLFL